MVSHYISSMGSGSVGKDKYIPMVTSRELCIDCQFRSSSDKASSISNQIVLSGSSYCFYKSEELKVSKNRSKQILIFGKNKASIHVKQNIHSLNLD